MRDRSWMWAAGNYQEATKKLRGLPDLDRLVDLSAWTGTLTQEVLSTPSVDVTVAQLVASSFSDWSDLVERLTPTVTLDDRALGFSSESALTVASAAYALARPGDVRADVVREDPNRAELAVRLDAVCPGLSEHLLGAAERLENPGPAAASQAANSIVELVDRFLREVGPDEEVLEWHGATGRLASELHEGRPTRRLRLLYYVSASPYAEGAGRAIDHVIALLDEAQTAKHTATGTGSLLSVRLTLSGIEASLALILPD